MMINERLLSNTFPDFFSFKLLGIRVVVADSAAATKFFYSAVISLSSGGRDQVIRGMQFLWEECEEKFEPY